jgi:hypothetical protein
MLNWKFSAKTAPPKAGKNEPEIIFLQVSDSADTGPVIISER